MTPASQAEDILARCLSLRWEGRESEVDALLDAAGGDRALWRRRLDEAWRLDRMWRPALPSPESAAGFTPLFLLGEGSTGRIYLALQEDLKRLVCLKSLHPGAVSPALAGRLRREGRLLAALDHKNIISIHGVIEHPSQGLCLVLPYVRGIPLSAAVPFLQERRAATVNDLRRFIAAGTADVEARLPAPWRPAAPAPAPADEALIPFLAGVMERVAGALAAAHGKGLVHRDVKPSNILLTPDGEPVLLDFGLTRAAVPGEMTLAGEFLGTPLYTAPECVWRGGGAADARSDIYSLGASFYQVFTGRPPFDGGGLGRTMELIEMGGAPAPRRYRPDLPPALENILMRCLERRPGARYPSAEALRRDLRAFIAGRPVSAPPPRRHGRAAALLVLGGVFLLLNAGIRLGEWHADREADRAGLILKGLSSAGVRPRVHVLPRTPRPSTPRVSSPAPIPPLLSEALPEIIPVRVRYTDPEGFFSLAPPPGWRRENLAAARSVGFRREDGSVSFAARLLDNPVRAPLSVLFARLEEATPGKPRFFGRPEAGLLEDRPFLRRKFFTQTAVGEEVHIVLLVDLGSNTLLLDGWSAPDDMEACRRDVEAMLADLRLTKP